MTSPRFILTFFFAAALYACACLLVYGTLAHAEAQPPAMSGKGQLSSDRNAAALHLNSVLGFPTVEKAARRAVVYRAMLSAPPAFDRWTSAETCHLSARPAADDKRSSVKLYLPGAALNALLSRRLADS